MSGGMQSLSFHDWPVARNLRFSLLYVDICVYVHECAGGRMCVCVRRREVKLGCHPQVPSTLFFEIESFIGLEHIHSSSTAG